MKMEFAQLSETQLKRTRDLENDMDCILVAYNKNYKARDKVRRGE